MSVSPKEHWKTCHLWYKHNHTKIPTELSCGYFNDLIFCLTKTKYCTKITKKEAKGVFMEKSDKKIDKIQEIIKYNTKRKYFGVWRPQDLYDAYKVKSGRPVKIGTLSISNICDTLWNEMSYNPGRFGTISPFDVWCIKTPESFIKQKFSDKDALYKVQYALSEFLSLVSQYDQSFRTNGYLNTDCVIINHVPTFYPTKRPVPNLQYKMLSSLVHCVHLIASQNWNDFKRKKYQNQIINAVQTRHADLSESDFDTLSRRVQYPELHKYQDMYKNVNYAIMEKNSAIMDTEMRIQSLQEYEIPGDTSSETALLQKQNMDLQKLEQMLDDIKKTIHRYHNNKIR